MYKILDINYDKDHLLALFRSAKKSLAKKNFIEATDVVDDPEISRLLNMFPYVPPLDPSVGLVQLRTDVRPYINDGNNGMIIFPIFGKLDVRFYSYQAPVVDGRPSLSPAQGAVSDELLAQVETTVSETLIVDKPTLINGQVVHSFHVYNNQNPVFLALKTPLEVEWAVALDAVNQYVS